MKQIEKTIERLVVLITGIIITACGNSYTSKNEVEYLPFQQREGGKWGLISQDGDILFSELFDNEPTMAVNGRFMVKNKVGLWEIYTAEEEPRKVGGEYLQASMFYEDVTPVVEKGKPIQFINRDGKVKVTLDEIDGNDVTECAQFIHGLAPVKAGGLWGVVNTEGKVVVEPQYVFIDIDQTGKMIGLEGKYAKQKWEDKQFSVFDERGNVIGTILAKNIDGIRNVQSSYRTTDDCVGDGVMVAVQKGGKSVEGLMDINGDWLIEPTAQISDYLQYQDGYFTYSNDSGCGVADKDGKSVLDASFHELYFIGDKLLSGKKTTDDCFALYNMEGKQISSDTYQAIFLFHTDKEYTLALKKDGKYTLIDRNGKEKNLQAKVHHISGFGTSPSFLLDRDCLDFSEIVLGLDITKDGFLGLRTTQTAPEAITVFNRHRHVERSINGNPLYHSYGYARTVQGDIKTGKAVASVGIDILGSIERGSVSGNRYSIGVRWTERPIPLYSVSYSSKTTKRLEGRTRELYDVLANAVRAIGKEIRTGANACVVDMGNRNYYHAYWTGDKAGLYFGMFDPNRIIITHYDKASEVKPISVLYP